MPESKLPHRERFVELNVSKSNMYFSFRLQIAWLDQNVPDVIQKMASKMVIQQPLKFIQVFM